MRAARSIKVKASFDRKILWQSDCAWFPHHHGYPDDRENAAADHVHDVLWLTRSAVNSVCNFSADTIRGACD